MDEDAFWELMDGSVKAARGGLDRQLTELHRRLTPLKQEQLLSFQHHFDSFSQKLYDHKLWGAAYLINGGCSDDGFHYFRSWVVSRGRDFYERVKADPEALADLLTENDDVEGTEFEQIAYVASRVWKDKHGEDPSLYDAIEETYADLPYGEPTGERWREAELAALLPKLHARYKEYYSRR